MSFTCCSFCSEPNASLIRKKKHKGALARLKEKQAGSQGSLQSQGSLRSQEVADLREVDDQKVVASETTARSKLGDAHNASMPYLFLLISFDVVNWFVCS